MVNELSISCANVERAILALKQRKMIVVTDPESRENEGDLIVAAEYVTIEHIAFMSNHGRGLICMPMSEQDFFRLGIPDMVTNNHSHHQTPFGVSIGAAKGISTGISAADRAHTIRTAVNPSSCAKSIVMPGHVFPLKAKSGGVLQRPGHTEACVDLMKLSGLSSAGVICEVMKGDGQMARGDDLVQLAKAHQLPMVSIEDLIRYRLIHQPMVSIQATAQLPIEPWGEFQIQVFSIDGREHVALTKPMSDSSAPALVRLHSSCLTGDVFGSMRCDCGPQLHIALGRIADNGGAILYMQQEGRGIGLVNKIKAYALQEQGMDTVEANQNLGFLPDQRQYLRAAEILSVLDMRRIRLLTNNPTKVAGLQQWGIDVVERVPIMIKPNHHNVNYLQTKQKKLGHLLGEMA